MKESSEEYEKVLLGVCPECGRRIVLPCLACQVETIRLLNRAGRYAPQEENEADLSIHLTDQNWQRRYEEVRDFRDKHGFPMWSARWFELIAKKPCTNPDKSQ